jgi:hypothetical protein
MSIRIDLVERLEEKYLIAKLHKDKVLYQSTLNDVRTALLNLEEIELLNERLRNQELAGIVWKENSI